MRKSERIQELKDHILQHGSDIESIDKFVQHKIRSSNSGWFIFILLVVLIIIGEIIKK